MALPKACRPMRFPTNVRALSRAGWAGYEPPIAPSAGVSRASTPSAGIGPRLASLARLRGRAAGGIQEKATGRALHGILEMALTRANSPARRRWFGRPARESVGAAASWWPRSIPATPILFLNTGKLFGETLRYRDRLQDVLGLGDVRSAGAQPGSPPEKNDPEGTLWSRDTDACCRFPQDRSAGQGAGRLRGDRHRAQTLPDGRAQRHGADQIRRWPLPFQSACRLDLDHLTRYIDEHRLRHPLVKDGYPSIGCMPCTRRVSAGEEYRAGRWAGLDEDECGIHAGIDSNVIPPLRSGGGGPPWRGQFR